MKYPWIDVYLLGKRGVTKDLQAEWNWIRYQIGGKMFSATTTVGANTEAAIHATGAMPSAAETETIKRIVVGKIQARNGAIPSVEAAPETVISQPI